MEFPRGPVAVAPSVTSIYAELGIRPVINATCHWTRFGGTIIPLAVRDAMRAAGDTTIDMRELLDVASRRIAHHTHAEAGHVVSGCAAALMVGAAAVMTGSDPVRMQRLPDTSGMKAEWIARRMPRRETADGQRYLHHGYAHAVRGAGGRFVEVGTEASVDLAAIGAAIGPDTAGIYWAATYESSVPTTEDVVALAHRAGVPVLVDASNVLPPPENLYRFVDAGADLVAFSGGKGLRGPQGSGILAGRADLIAAARAQSAPEQGIGRPCKVSKEEIVGLLVALEAWAALDHRHEQRQAEKKTLWLFDQLGGLVDAEAEYVSPDHLGRPFPAVHVHIDPDHGMTADDLLARLLAGDPAVAAMPGFDRHTIRLDVRDVEERDVQRVADAVLAVLMPGSVGF